MPQYRFRLTDDATREYVETCARIRNISVTSLLQRLLGVITDEQMIAAILDDDGARTRRKGEHPPRQRAAT